MKNDFWGELKQREITVLKVYYKIFFLKQEIKASIDIYWQQVSMNYSI